MSKMDLKDLEIRKLLEKPRYYRWIENYGNQDSVQCSPEMGGMIDVSVRIFRLIVGVDEVKNT